MSSGEGTKKLKNSTWASFDLSKNGEILSASEDLLETTGISPKDLEGKNVVYLIDQMCVDRYKSKVVHSLRNILSENQTKANIFAELKLSNDQCRVPVLIFMERKKHNKGYVSLVFHDLSGYDNFIRSFEEEKFRSSSLIEHGNVIIIRLDRQLAIKDIIGNTENLIGHSRDEFISKPEIWEDYLKNRFQKRLLAKLKNDKGKFTDEVSVVNSKTKKIHYILISGLPVYTETGKFDGWEGFGFDITEKKEAEIKLKLERARLNALYEVSKVLRVDMDPALVALKGLESLAKATNASSGFVIFQNEHEQSELTCTFGLSEKYVESIQKRLHSRGVVNNAMKEKIAVIVDSLDDHKWVDKDASKSENLQSCLVVPMIYEDSKLGLKSFGAICLTSTKSHFFKEEDKNLVKAAANQIVLVARQAKSFVREKELATSLRKTLDFSKEISSQKTLNKIASRAIEGVRREIPTRRAWLGVVNEQGTFLSGQGAYGKGLDLSIASLKLDISQAHTLFRKILLKEEAIVLTKVKEFDNSAISQIISDNNIDTLIVLPLVASGTLVGTIVIEPKSDNRKYLKSKVQMLETMASEIANVILTRKLEGKLVDAEKMRMAGLLASGVAHNFNNLLQAIMGQASLIQVQAKNNQDIQKASQTILDSSIKGADLIAQLMDLSVTKEPIKKRFSINRLISASKGLYKSLVGPDVKIKFDLTEAMPEVTADSSQIQHVLSHILINAAEASEQQKRRLIEVKSRKRIIAINELEPQLSPGLYIEITVTDNGRGMSEKEMNRCFEPFYTSKDRIGTEGLGLKGAGLGLPASYAIAKQHNGTIFLTSKKGQGTVASIFLPAVIEVANLNKRVLRDEKTVTKKDKKPVRKKRVTKKPKKRVNK